MIQKKTQSNMMDRIKFLVDAFGHNEVIMAVAGFFGALVYVMRDRHLGFVASLAVVLTGTSCAIFLGPFTVSLIGMEHTSQVYAGIGFLVGWTSKEVLELAFKVFQELERNPRFITDAIKNKIRRR